MLRSLLAGIGRALDFALNVAAMPFRWLIGFMFPAVNDVPPPSVHEVEQALDFDPFEQAQERQADREEALADTLTWSADTLRTGTPAPLPQSLAEFGDWLHGLRKNELERLLTADSTDVYAHMFLEMPMTGLPTVDEIRPVPRSETPAEHDHILEISEPRGWPAAAY